MPPFAANPVSRQFDDGSSGISPAVLLLAVGAVLLAVVLYRRRAGALEDLGLHLKTTHFLPFSIQCVIFFYWSLYWRELPPYLPHIALQIGFAYALDALLGLVRDGRYKLTAGPLPIVGSTNLFIQFPASDWTMQYAAIALALLSKALLTRNGRHLLNPSAFGIAVVGALNLAMPQLGNGDVAHVFDLPPNMAEVVLLLALVVQTRVPVVLCSVGCVAGLMLHGAVSPVHNFSPFWSPVTLVVVLLITDPATSPRSPLGRLLYGAMFGVMAGLCGEALTVAGLSDFYGKILPLPLLNVLAPGIDHVGRALQRRMGLLAVALHPSRNLSHVVLFFAFMCGGLLQQGKPSALQGIAHRYNHTRFVHWTADGRATCESNALFCDGFTFASEARCWVASYGPSEHRCGAGDPRFP